MISIEPPVIWSPDSRHGHVERYTNERKWDLQQLTGQDIESESSVDEETVEFANTANDHRLEQGEEEQAVGVWIFDNFPSLFRTPLGTFDTLRVPSYSLDKLGFGLVVCPPDFGWGVG